MIVNYFVFAQENSINDSGMIKETYFKSIRYGYSIKINELESYLSEKPKKFLNLFLSLLHRVNWLITVGAQNFVPLRWEP